MITSQKVNTHTKSEPLGAHTVFSHLFLTPATSLKSNLHWNCNDSVNPMGGSHNAVWKTSFPWTLIRKLMLHHESSNVSVISLQYKPSCTQTRSVLEPCLSLNFRHLWPWHWSRWPGHWSRSFRQVWQCEGQRTVSSNLTDFAYVTSERENECV